DLEPHGAAGQKRTVAKIFRGGLLFKGFVVGVRSAKLEHDAQAHAHLATAFRAFGLENFRDAGAQAVKVDRLLKISDGAQILAQRFRGGARLAADDDDGYELSRSQGTEGAA